MLYRKHFPVKVKQGGGNIKLPWVPFAQERDLLSRKRILDWAQRAVRHGESGPPPLLACLFSQSLSQESRAAHTDGPVQEQMPAMILPGQSREPLCPEILVN